MSKLEPDRLKRSRLETIRLWPSGRDRPAAGVVQEVEFRRRDVAKDIEYRAMHIDCLLQAQDLVTAGGTVDLDHGPDVAEAGPHALIGREEPAQVLPAFDLHRHMVERDAERLGVEPVSDLLAGAERGQNELGRIGSGIGPAEGRYLIQLQAEIADCRLAGEAGDLTRRDRYGRQRLAWTARQSRSGRVENILQTHGHRALLALRSRGGHTMVKTL